MHHRTNDKKWSLKMKKLFDLIYVEPYRRDMSAHEVQRRNNKLALILISVLFIGLLFTIPIYAESDCRSCKFEQKQEEWICPNERCGFCNRDFADYCGLCGTQKPKKRR
jgi:hypothetical protein